jgi:hypothetical protein
MTRRLRGSGALREIAAGALLIACLLLQGCGRSNPPPAPDILKAQREALEKAKATEKVVQDAAQRRAGEMDSQQK